MRTGARAARVRRRQAQARHRPLRMRAHVHRRLSISRPSPAASRLPRQQAPRSRRKRRAHFGDGDRAHQEGDDEIEACRRQGCTSSDRRPPWSPARASSAARLASANHMHGEQDRRGQARCAASRCAGRWRRPRKRRAHQRADHQQHVDPRRRDVAMARPGKPGMPSARNPKNSAAPSTMLSTIDVMRVAHRRFGILAREEGRRVNLRQHERRHAPAIVEQRLAHICGILRRERAAREQAVDEKRRDRQQRRRRRQRERHRKRHRFIERAARAGAIALLHQPRKTRQHRHADRDADQPERQLIEAIGDIEIGDRALFKRSERLAHQHIDLQRAARDRARHRQRHEPLHARRDARQTELAAPRRRALRAPPHPNRLQHARHRNRDRRGIARPCADRCETAKRATSRQRFNRIGAAAATKNLPRALSTPENNVAAVMQIKIRHGDLRQQRGQREGLRDRRRSRRTARR